jgi:hypothetical protein
MIETNIPHQLTPRTRLAQMVYDQIQQDIDPESNAVTWDGEALFEMLFLLTNIPEATELLKGYLCLDEEEK